MKELQMIVASIGLVLMIVNWCTSEVNLGQKFIYTAALAIIFFIMVVLDVANRRAEMWVAIDTLLVLSYLYQTSTYWAKITDR